MTDLQMLAINSLVPHPANPRLQLREDVVEQIAAQIRATGTFAPEHALLVWVTYQAAPGLARSAPAHERYTIVSGHHRAEAAKRAGLTEVPCWVREMSQREALMQLVLANAQGELSPLEIGWHARTAVPPADGGRGIAGGLREYARDIGKTHGYVSQLRSAAEVLREIETGYSSNQFNRAELLDKAKHLYEISRARRELWPLLASRMLSSDWAAADVAHHVGKVADFSIPAGESHWLPLQAVVQHYLATREFSPKTVTRLLAAADQTRKWIAENDNQEAASRFEQWLADNSGGRSWQPRAIAEYLSRLIAEQFIVAGWHHGNWRDHIGALDDGTVTLVLTDPPYGQGFQSDYRLDRRAERKHEPIAADDDTAPGELLEALQALHPKLADDAHVLVFCGWANEPAMRDVVGEAGYTLRGSLIWDKEATGMGDPETTFAPAHERILHAVKGSPLLFRRAPDLLRHPRCDSSRHPTEKPVSLLRELIEATTAEGQLVVDPFGGVASTPDAARAAGRRWWGCEIEEEYWRIGEERLS